MWRVRGRGVAVTLLTRVVLLPLVLIAAHSGPTNAPPCADSLNPVHLSAPFVPGTITLDGNSDDWKTVSGQQFEVLQAIAPDPAEKYPFGSITVKVAHDGQNLFVLLEAPGPYVWNATSPHLAASAALMFGVGDDATYYNMGGCASDEGSCSVQTCAGHEVDLIHFELSTAVPGRIYGGNLGDNLKGTGTDSIGHLDDMFAWNPHCKQVDSAPALAGVTPKGQVAASSAANDWQGTWGHSSIDLQFGLVPSDAPFAIRGEEGKFVFEFQRPLRTHDQYQQDVQFVIGGSHRFGAAIWYPINAQMWAHSQHYVLSCDWLILDLLPAPEPYTGWEAVTTSGGLSTDTVGAVATLALLLALSSVFVVIAVGWWVRSNARQFIPMTQVQSL